MKRLISSVLLFFAATALAQGAPNTGANYDGSGAARNSAGALYISTAGLLPTYSAAASFTPASGVLSQVCGSATKTVHLKQIIIAGTASSAGTLVLNVIKKSTAPSGGTGTAVTPVSVDDVDAASGASFKYYTAAPTAGTAIGTVASFSLGFPTTAGYQIPAIFQDASNTKPLTLRGAAECAELQTSSSALTGGNIQVTVTWTETYP